MSTIDDIKTRLADLQAQARNYRQTQGAGYNPFDRKVDAAIEALCQAQLADYAARWPTIKAAWNAAVAKYTGPKGVDCADLPRIEAAAGIKFNDLKLVKAMVEG